MYLPISKRVVTVNVSYDILKTFLYYFYSQSRWIITSHYSFLTWSLNKVILPVDVLYVYDLNLMRNFWYCQFVKFVQLSKSTFNSTSRAKVYNFYEIYLMSLEYLIFLQIVWPSYDIFPLCKSLKYALWW